jgi:hypothetical protein
MRNPESVISFFHNCEIMVSKFIREKYDDYVNNMNCNIYKQHYNSNNNITQEMQFLNNNGK